MMSTMLLAKTRSYAFRRAAFLGRLAAPALVVAAFAIAAPSAASAQSWSSNTTVHGPSGGTATVNRSGSAYYGGGSRSTTVTGPYGGTATKDVQRSYDPATGTWSRSKTVTAPSGASRTVTGSGSRAYYGGSASGSRTVTGPYGGSRTTTWQRVR